jgi:NADH-quinone oxidoreductase subunit E
MTPLEVEELATFYTFIYREPVGKYVIHVCDSLICWMESSDMSLSAITPVEKLAGHQNGRAPPADGLFTLLPVCCIGYCDRAPAMLINRKVHGPLTTASLDALIDKFREGVS